MKIRFVFYSIFLPGIFCFLLTNCKKGDLKTLPTITVATVANLTADGATAGGTISSDGGEAITVRGICWNTSQNPTSLDPHVDCGSGTGTFSGNITGLSPGKTYYLRAYAKNSVGTAYSVQSNFTALIIAPILSTTEVSSLTAFGAVMGGSITGDGGSAVTARGICWATTPNPTVANSKTADGSGLGNFVSIATGLLPGTTYYVRGYATNATGTGYGNQLTFNTVASVPALTSVEATGITHIAATSGGNITSENGSPIISRGVCWATVQNPTILDSKTNNGSGTGTFSSSLIDLTPGTTYYLRAYATNSAGTAYGNQVTFRTNNPVIPTITTINLTSITNNSVVTGGNVTANGGSPITAYGVCWATTPTPTIANTKTTDGYGMGNFTSNLTGLGCLMTYYVRAYATNAVGTAYGNQLSFTTILVLPSVSSFSPSNVSYNSATCGGSVISDGCSTVSVRGICWATTPNPTISSSKITNGSGTGNFTASITGLTVNTTYYVRAFATNSVGTTYGTQVTFVTVYALPTLTTELTYGENILIGNITSDGGLPVTVRGFCWSSSPNPTTQNSKSLNGSGSGYFTNSFPWVLGIFYVRSYATNALGTSYGNQITNHL